MSTKVIEQMLKDQKLLAKQMEATGQPVAKLTLAQMENQQHAPDNPTSLESSFEHRVPQFQPIGQNNHSPNHHRREGNDRFQPKNLIPKMTFPKFAGENPYIWRDKCQDYFKLFDLPASLWSTMASLGMDGKAAKWLHVYK